MDRLWIKYDDYHDRYGYIYMDYWRLLDDENINIYIYIHTLITYISYFILIIDDDGWWVMWYFLRWFLCFVSPRFLAQRPGIVRGTDVFPRIHQFTATDGGASQFLRLLWLYHALPICLSVCLSIVIYTHLVSLSTLIQPSTDFKSTINQP